MKEYTVGEVAGLSHISVRTLHHYDDIGLLKPSGRSAAGYRLYSGADLRRLQEILFYRELEFGLAEIAQILADPDAAAGGTVAMDLAEAHRQHLIRWFYDCGYDMHRGLAELYVSDPRFTATYDEIEPGFSGYVRTAILANADRAHE